MTIDDELQDLFSEEPEDSTWRTEDAFGPTEPHKFLSQREASRLLGKTDGLRGQANGPGDADHSGDGPENRKGQPKNGSTPQ